MSETPYNPLERMNLATSVVRAMLNNPVVQLPPEPFEGAGIYAIYYTGDYDPYRRIAENNTSGNFAAPIYVGKAAPAGARKGGLRTVPGRDLFNRLSEHADSIRLATNLKLEDFSCRYLVVDDIWIPLGESLLIERFAPVWNKVIDGFGNHIPGEGRNKQKRSRWDTVHPGRTWAMLLPDNKETADQILYKLEKYLSKNHFGHATKTWDARL